MTKEQIEKLTNLQTLKSRVETAQREVKRDNLLHLQYMHSRINLAYILEADDINAISELVESLISERLDTLSEKIGSLVLCESSQELKPITL